VRVTQKTLSLLFISHEGAIFNAFSPTIANHPQDEATRGIELFTLK